MSAVDHPFVASLYGTIQTGTHLHFLMEYCEGGELYGLLTTQPTKRLKEAHMRFYVAEVCLPACMRALVLVKSWAVCSFVLVSLHWQSYTCNHLF